MLKQRFSTETRAAESIFKVSQPRTRQLLLSLLQLTADKKQSQSLHHFIITEIQIKYVKKTHIFVHEKSQFKF